MLRVLLRMLLRVLLLRVRVCLCGVMHVRRVCRVRRVLRHVRRVLRHVRRVRVVTVRRVRRVRSVALYHGHGLAALRRVLRRGGGGGGRRGTGTGTGHGGRARRRGSAALPALASRRSAVHLLRGDEVRHYDLPLLEPVRTSRVRAGTLRDAKADHFIIRKRVRYGERNGYRPARRRASAASAARRTASTGAPDCGPCSSRSACPARAARAAACRR